MTLPGPSDRWPQERFVDPLTGEPIPGPFPASTSGPARQQHPGERASESGRAEGTQPPAEGRLPAEEQAAAAEHGTAAAENQQETPPHSHPIPGFDLGGHAEPASEHSRAKRRRAVAVSLGVVALLVLAFLVGLSQSGGGPGRTALPSTARHFPVLPPPTTESRVPVAPVIRGWQGVGVPSRGVAYDVPPTWKVESPGTVVGYNDQQGQPLVIMGGVSTYREGFCAGHRYSYRAHLGFSRTDRSDMAGAAKQAVQDWADAGYSDKQVGGSAQVSIGAPSTVPINAGGTTAIQVAGRVTVPQPKDCDAPTVLINAVAVPLPGGGMAVCVTEADQDVPDALPAAELQQIIGTIRPLHR